jgi:hypothetical protein
MQKPKQMAAAANNGHGHSTVKLPRPFPKRPVLLPQSLLKPMKSACPVSLSQSTKVNSQMHSINDELEASLDPESLLFDVSNDVNDDMIQFDFTNGAF